MATRAWPGLRSLEISCGFSESMESSRRVRASGRKVMTMSARVSEGTIERLRASLPAVEAHRTAIIEGMAASLAAADPGRDGWRAARAATDLIDMLIDEARHLTSGRPPNDAAAVLAEHKRHGIERSHHSRFGDALAAVMVDAGGAALPRPVGGAWGDTFWAAVRRIEADGRPAETEGLREAA